MGDKSAFVGGMKLKISELGKVITGNTPSKKIKEFWDKDDVGFVKPDIISDEHIVKIKNEDCNEFISNAAINKAGIVPKNSIFVTCIGNIGKIGVATENLAFNQQINAITPNENVNLDYLCYAIFANKTRLQDIANAPIVPLLNKSQFSEFELEFDMDINTQTRIVHELNTVSNIILKYKQELLLLDELVKARFVEMFGDPVENTMNWPEIFIGDKCFVTKLAGFEYTQYIDYEESGEVVMVKAQNVKNGKLNRKDLSFISKKVSDSLPRSQLAPGDVVMTYVGANIGDVAVIDDVYKYHLAPNVAKIRPNAEVYNSIYFMYMLMLLNIYIVKNSADTAKAALSMERIRKLKVFIPPIELQNQFASFVQEIDKSRLLNICLKSLVESVLKIRIFSEYKKSS